MKKVVCIVLIVVILLFGSVSCSSGVEETPQDVDSKNEETTFNDEQYDSEQPQIESALDKINMIRKAEEGDVVTFGVYEQDNNMTTKDPVEWLVLKKNESEVVILSKYCLKYSKYDNSSTDWENSYVRSWLNSYFFDNAFDEDEKEFILDTKNITNGKEHSDKIYLLSSDEAMSYFSKDADRITEATLYAFEESFSSSKREYADMKNNGWWLRNKSNNTNMLSLCTVHGNDGSVNKEFGMFPANDWLLVRPVIRLEISNTDSK